jgi:hypothetical protein
MSASVPEATTDYSTGSGASRGPGDAPSRGRKALAGVAFLAALMLVASTFLTLIEVTTGEATLDTRSGLQHHSIAMLLLGVAVLPMALGALRGARPAMAGLAAIGAVVLLVAFTVDLPAALDEGIYGERYEGAAAKPAVGFYVETLAGALLVVAGGLLLLAGGGRRGALADAP